MQNRYRFIGTETLLGGQKLDRFGQVIVLDEAVANETMRHPRGAAILPDEVFEEIGFTDAELVKFAYPGAQTAATPEAAAFRDKKTRAITALHAMRAVNAEEVR